MGFGFPGESLVAAGIGAAGGVISGAMSAGATREINDANIAYAREATQTNQAFAREQNAFQERMSSTAYQRARSDMEAAGYNPMMAFSQGGASSPSGSSGSAVTPNLQTPDKGEILRRSLSSAMDMSRLQKDLDRQDADIALTETANRVKEQEGELTRATAVNRKKESMILEERQSQAAAETPAARAEARARTAQATLAEKQAKIDEKLIGVDNTVRRVGEALGAVTGARSALRPYRGGTSHTPDGFVQDSSGDLIHMKTGEVFSPYRGGR